MKRVGADKVLVGLCWNMLQTKALKLKKIQTFPEDNENNRFGYFASSTLLMIVVQLRKGR